MKTKDCYELCNDIICQLKKENNFEWAEKYYDALNYGGIATEILSNIKQITKEIEKEKIQLSAELKNKLKELKQCLRRYL